MGGSIRLGKRRPVSKTADSVLRQMYGKTDTIEERHRYDVMLQEMKIMMCLDQLALG